MIQRADITIRCERITDINCEDHADDLALSVSDADLDALFYDIGEDTLVEWLRYKGYEVSL